MYYAIKNGQIIAWGDTRAIADFNAKKAGYTNYKVIPAYLYK